MWKWGATWILGMTEFSVCLYSAIFFPAIALEFYNPHTSFESVLQLLLAITFCVECLPFDCYFVFTFVISVYLYCRFSAEAVKKKQEDLGDVCSPHILLEMRLLFFRFFLRLN